MLRVVSCRGGPEAVPVQWLRRFMADLSLDTRRAVAAVVRRDGGLVLAVLRPDEPGEELPGIWGLPATTLGDGESPEDGLRRLGREKLGVDLAPGRPLAEGEQQRTDHILHMTVHEASLEVEPRLPARTSDAQTGDRPAGGVIYRGRDHCERANPPSRYPCRQLAGGDGGAVPAGGLQPVA